MDNPHTFRFIPSDHIMVIMYYVYVLKSLKDEKLYIGSTNDLKRRLSEHNNGLNRSTKARRPFEIRYYEACINERDARIREYNLKKDGKALGQLKRRISESLK
ncbi:MAG: GIY-YIG nuclease family protein [Patescibacteria group bacterium]